MLGAAQFRDRDFHGYDNAKMGGGGGYCCFGVIDPGKQIICFKVSYGSKG